MKAIQQANKENGEVLTLDWAVKTTQENAELLLTYMKSCSLSDDAKERMRYYESCKRTLGQLLTGAQLVGLLSDEDTLLSEMFNGVPMDVIDFDPGTGED